MILGLSDLATQQGLAAASPVDAVFETYAKDGSEGKRGIKLEMFKEALHSVRPEFHYLSKEEAKQLFVESDLENDGILDVKEFSYALGKKFPVEQVISVLPLHRLLESALPGIRSRHPDEHLDIFVNLKDEEIVAMVAAVSPEIERLLRETVLGLRKAKEPQDPNAGDNVGAKFDVVTLSAGTIEDFHKGLQGRVGGEVCTAAFKFTHH